MATPAPRTDGEHYYRDRDIMRMLTISKPSLLRLRRNQGFPGPHMKLAGRISLTRVSSVEAWIAQQEDACVEFQPVVNQRRRAMSEKAEA